MAASEQSPAEMLGQLEQARKLCLADPSVYNQIVPGIVPIIQTAASVEIRRWGADFVAEVFATPALPGHQKEQLISDKVMELLRAMLEMPTEDVAVVKSAVQACASIYPYVFRRVYVASNMQHLGGTSSDQCYSISHPDLALVWRDMTTIKINILQRLDVAPVPIRVCCIKFLQKVVQIQTPGQIADPRVCVYGQNPDLFFQMADNLPRGRNTMRHLSPLSRGIILCCPSPTSRLRPQAYWTDCSV